ncbi:MAG: M20 family metallopeptidase [Desulfobacterales bacterium]|nr:MAG: M20 family metallopeptidase [Desulfobacterales bacterium]
MDIDYVCERIDEEKLVNIIADLIRIPSHSDVPGQEGEIVGFVNDLLLEWGIDATLQKVAEDRFNIIVKMKGYNGGQSLALNGHLDTVPPGEGMKQPYHPVVENGCLYGRGSCDMKGAVGAMLYTLYLLKKCEVRLGGDLYFTAVVGEETGGTGTRSLIRRGFRSDYAVVGEPTGLDLVISHKGVLQLEIKIRGKAAHASMPECGVSAIRAVSDFIQRLEKDLVPRLHQRIQKHVGAATLNFGVIQGGVKVNTVADCCSLQIDRRWVESETQAQIISEIEAILHEVCNKNPALKPEVISLIPSDGYFGPFAISEDHRLIRFAKQAMNMVEKSPRIAGMQCWSDAATLMKAGIPTVLLGPGSLAQAHTNDEFVELNQLVDAAKCYLALTSVICGWR